MRSKSLDIRKKNQSTIPANIINNKEKFPENDINLINFILSQKSIDKNECERVLKNISESEPKDSKFLLVLLNGLLNLIQANQNANSSTDYLDSVEILLRIQEVQTVVFSDPKGLYNFYKKIFKECQNVIDLGKRVNKVVKDISIAPDSSTFMKKFLEYLCKINQRESNLGDKLLFFSLIMLKSGEDFSFLGNHLIITIIKFDSNDNDFSLSYEFIYNLMNARKKVMANSLSNYIHRNIISNKTEKNTKNKDMRDDKFQSRIEKITQTLCDCYNVECFIPENYYKLLMWLLLCVTKFRDSSSLKENVFTLMKHLDNKHIAKLICYLFGMKKKTDKFSISKKVSPYPFISIEWANDNFDFKKFTPDVYLEVIYYSYLETNNDLKQNAILRSFIIKFLHYFPQQQNELKDKISRAIIDSQQKPGWRISKNKSDGNLEAILETASLVLEPQPNNGNQNADGQIEQTSEKEAEEKSDENIEVGGKKDDEVSGKKDDEVVEKKVDGIIEVEEKGDSSEDDDSDSKPPEKIMYELYFNLDRKPLTPKKILLEKNLSIKNALAQISNFLIFGYEISDDETTIQRFEKSMNHKNAALMQSVSIDETDLEEESYYHNMKMNKSSSFVKQGSLFGHERIAADKSRFEPIEIFGLSNYIDRSLPFSSVFFPGNKLYVTLVPIAHIKLVSAYPTNLANKQVRLMPPSNPIAPAELADDAPKTNDDEDDYGKLLSRVSPTELNCLSRILDSISIDKKVYVSTLNAEIIKIFEDCGKDLNKFSQEICQKYGLDE